MKRAAIYLRVSTVDQHTSNQEQELRQVAERAGWEVVEVYGITASAVQRGATNGQLRCSLRDAAGAGLILSWPGASIV